MVRRKGECRRGNPDLLLDLSDKGLGQRLNLLDVATGKAPQTGVGAAMRAAPSQQYHTISVEQGVDDGPHAGATAIADL
jgi:hypothetical protein